MPSWPTPAGMDGCSQKGKPPPVAWLDDRDRDSALCASVPLDWTGYKGSLCVFGVKRDVVERLFRCVVVTSLARAEDIPFQGGPLLLPWQPSRPTDGGRRRQQLWLTCS